MSTKDQNQKYTGPKSTKPKVQETLGGEFVYKSNKVGYVGKYIKTFRGKYLAGTEETPSSQELEKIGTRGPNGEVLTAAALAVVALLGFFKKLITSADRKNGKTKRYFVQIKPGTKIVETDKDTYYQSIKELPYNNAAVVDWIIEGPAEDQIINGFPYEGAASKNQKTIAALESTIPGISTYITDYGYLVEDPAVNAKQPLYSDTIVQQDPETQLENSRKANFDLKK